jgi:hypothetical protein
MCLGQEVTSENSRNEILRIAESPNFEGRLTTGTAINHNDVKMVGRYTFHCDYRGYPIVPDRLRQLNLRNSTAGIRRYFGLGDTQGYCLSSNFWRTYETYLFARLSTDPSSSIGPLCCYRNRSGFVLSTYKFGGSQY